jgi:hypothetical protein
VHVLRRFREAVDRDGILLDLQVIRPHPRVEVEGRIVYVADGSPLFEGADAARAAVDLLIDERLLVEEAIDDHDVLKHHPSGANLVEEWPAKKRQPPPPTLSMLRAIASECVLRERCRLRRLRRIDPGAR